MESEKETVIAEHTVLKGDLSLKGNLILAGQFTGNIDTSGSVVVTESGKLRGKVNCLNLVNSGVIDGEIHCAQCVILKNGSRFKGDSFSRSFIMSEYAEHAGDMKMAW